MEKKQRHHKVFIYFGVILFFSICFLLGLAFGRFAASHDLSIKFSDLFIILMAMYLNILLQINIHEFGHFFFGKLFGYELISYRIMMFAWDEVNGKRQFSIKRNEGYGGLCAMLPRGEIKKMQYACFIAGGVIFNTLSTVIFILILLNNLSNPSFVLIGSLMVCLFVNGIMIISNALPLTLGLMETDGKLFFSLFKKDENHIATFEKFNMMTSLMSGTRPRDLVIHSQTSICNHELTQLEIIQLLYRYFKALDSVDVGQLNVLIQQLEEQLPRVPITISPGITYELIYYYLAVEPDITKAKRYYEPIKKQLLKDVDVNGCRVNCACSLYLDEDIEKAAEWYKLGIGVSNKFKLKGQALMEVSLLEQLNEKIGQTKTT